MRMQNFHPSSSTPPAWDSRLKKSRTRAPGLLPAHSTIWGAQGSRVRLTDGLARTKETPTSVPTAPHSIPAAHPFHALRVGNAGGGLSRNLAEGAAAQRPAVAVTQRGFDGPAVQPVEPEKVGLLLATGEMHDADHLMGRIRLDKEAAARVEGRRGIARHPVAIRRKKVDRQVLGKDHVIERRLLDKKELCPLQHLREDTRPSVPMRRVAMQCEYPAVDHRIAPQTIGGAPAESLPIILPRQCPAERLRPLIVSLVGAIDLGSDRQPVATCCAHVKIDHPPVLN